MFNPWPMDFNTISIQSGGTVPLAHCDVADPIGLARLQVRVQACVRPVHAAGRDPHAPLPRGRQAGLAMPASGAWS
jgi:hypothetical protein